MHEISCPHCRAAMQFVPEMAGNYVACPICRQTFVMPKTPPSAVPPQVAAYSVPAGYYSDSHYSPHAGYGARGVRRDWLAGVKVPILISGILNAVASMVWIMTCFGIIFAIPLIILCVFEFSYYSNADTRPRRVAVQDGRTIGIWEIVVGAITLNMISLICGILAVANANQAERELAAAPL